MKNKIALIEVDHNTREINSIDCMSAYLGFLSKDYKIIKKSTMDFVLKNTNDIPEKIDCFFGSLNFSKSVFSFLGIHKDKLKFDTYPFPLTKIDSLESFYFYKRDIIKTNIGNLIKGSKPFFYDSTIFIKPFKEKGFHAGIIDFYLKESIDNYFSFNDFLAINHQYFDIEDGLYSIECYVSTRINIDAEFRVYIKNGEILGSKQYKGDYHFYLDDYSWAFIEKQCLPYLFRKGIKTLSLDIGIEKINDKNKTFVMECNDAYAIGNYGLDDNLFADFLEQRFLELTGLERLFKMKNKKIIVLLFLLSLPLWAKFRDRDRQIKPRPSVSISASPSGVITSSPYIL